MKTCDKQDVPFGDTHAAPVGSQPLELRSHPRLLVGPERIAGLKKPPTLEWLKGVDAWVREKADQWKDMPAFIEWNKGEFCFCINHGRELEVRILSLIVRWLQSGEALYRDGVIKHVRWMLEHDPWSEAFVWGKPDIANVFDLNHGGRATTLAIAYDLLCDSLTDDEKSLFLDVARKRVLEPGLNTFQKGGQWWYAAAHNNWNGVCAGGAGMLCLSFYDDCNEARELLPKVEHSLDVFMRAHEENSGGSEEGTGYWNYGMRFAALFLRSYEESTGKRHPLLALPCLPDSLVFPLDFSPHGLDVGFGDIPGFGQPLPFHYDTARALKCDKAIRLIDARLEKNPHPEPSTHTATGMNYWDSLEGSMPLWLLIHDGVASPEPEIEENVARVVPGLDWGLLADRMPEPRLYMSVRGGNAAAHHAHDDLLSYNCCVGKEILVGNPKPGKYMPTTFTPRRGEIPDINPQFKNTILINGVGMYHGSRTDAVDLVNAPACKGIRMDATTAFTKPRNMSRVDFVGRLFLMLDRKAFLVVDAILSPKGGPSLSESRLHSYGEVELTGNGAVVTGKDEALRISYASSIEAFLATATTAPTTARDRPATMLRWCCDAHIHEHRPRTTILATLLTPGIEAAKVEVKQEGEDVEIQTIIAGESTALHLRTDLVMEG